MSNDAIPHLGQTVCYHNYGTPNGEYHSEQRAAVVTALIVSSPGHSVVSLAILNTTGIFFRERVNEGMMPGQWSFIEPNAVP